MHWKDGSIYKGYWEKGVQSGLGIMTFNDGVRKAGIFKDNVYQTPLQNLEQIEEFEGKKKL